MNVIEQHRCFGGMLGYYSHEAETTGCTMRCENRKSLDVRYFIPQYAYFPGLLVTVFVAGLGADEMSPERIQEEDLLDQRAAEPAAMGATAGLSIDDMSLTTTRETNILDQLAAEQLAIQEQSPNRRMRDHPVQAPTIPHAIKGYPINKDINQCLACHDKNVAPLVKAPTIAVSHFQNRDGVYLANVSLRRYICTQCHVAQRVSE